ncbi:MAG: hypothetical protein DDT20_00873 [Firmicutes bacterium]|nr:hypothetical protein [Bacillota bacterium]MBT9176553.1 hypothetical protein [Bacillota bacterium]
MSKMSELELLVEELRKAAQSLVAIADSLTAMFGGDAEMPEPQTDAEIQMGFYNRNYQPLLRGGEEG